MNADTIAKAMLQMRKDTREKAGLINKKLLSPSSGVLDAIKSAGGIIGAENGNSGVGQATHAHATHTIPGKVQLWLPSLNHGW